MAQSALRLVNDDILNIEGQIAKPQNCARHSSDVRQNQRVWSLPDSCRARRDWFRYQTLQKCWQKELSVGALHGNHLRSRLRKRSEVYSQQFADEVFGRSRLQGNLDSVCNVNTRTDTHVNDWSKNCRSRTQDRSLPNEDGAVGAEREVADINYKALCKRKREAQLASDENHGDYPSRLSLLSSPPAGFAEPMIIFPQVPRSFAVGIVFVLILDHLEDKIVGISDIEKSLSMKTLAVIPHVRRKKREQLARLVADDKFSQFAEALAGLRNLLDSPRYQEMSKVLLCMSTRPGEGKTITSCGLAISCAQSGQKTLLVDFDLRARVSPDSKAVFGFSGLATTLAKSDSALFGSFAGSSASHMDLSDEGVSEDQPRQPDGHGTSWISLHGRAKHYDRVIIDSPPFGIVGDVMTLASLVDSVMIMCCPDRTRFRPIKYAARHLTESGARVIGVIVNDVDFGRRNQFSQYDYHYRYAYRYTSRYGAYGQGKRGRKDAVPSEGAQVASRPVYHGDDLAPSSPVARQDIVDISMTDDD